MLGHPILKSFLRRCHLVTLVCVLLYATVPVRGQTPRCPSPDEHERQLLRDGDGSECDENFNTGNYALFLEPVAGITTARHPAPSHFAVPVGTELKFLVLTQPADEVRWEGAVPLQPEEPGETLAVRSLNSAGRATIKVQVLRAGVAVWKYDCAVDVFDIPVHRISVRDVNVMKSRPAITEDASNEESVEVYFGDSIAGLTKIAKNAYRTSIDRPLTFQARKLFPQEIAPLLEWRVNGQAAVLRSRAFDFKASEPGIYTISAGPPGHPAEVGLEIYEVQIVSASPLTQVGDREIIPEGTPVTFEAVTNPTGYEQEITWLSATKYGTGNPVLGRGPTFTAQFDDTFGPHSDGGLWQWLGVKADNAVFGQDQKGLPGACCETATECQILPEATCAALDAWFGGEGSTCAVPPGELTEIPAQLALYQVSTPVVDLNYATALASNVFSLTGTATEDNQRIIVENGARRLVVYKASAAFDYQDESALWAETYVGTAMSEQAATTFAMNFLSANVLLPELPFEVAASLRHLKNNTTGAIVANHWRVGFAIELDAMAGIGPEMLVPLSGAYIDVRVGNNEIIGLQWHVREVEAIGTLSTYDLETAAEIAMEQDDFFAACPMGAELDYELNPVAFTQGFAAPAALLAANGPHGSAARVPASPFSPRVRILSPDPIPEYEACSPVFFSALVAGGTPPFNYAWRDSLEYARRLLEEDPANPSDPDGLLGDQPSFSTQLSGGTHLVELVVTDSNGQRTQTNTALTVNGGGCAQLNQQCQPPNNPTLTSAVRAHGWTMNADITADDGLRLSKVTFNGNMLAHSMMLPFYKIKTQLIAAGEAGELRQPAGANVSGNLHSQLLSPGISVRNRGNDLIVQACYWVDLIPAGANTGQMKVCQNYIFNPESRFCAPGDPASCASFRPHVSWDYTGPQNNGFISMEVAQRFEFDLQPLDLCAYFADPDDPIAFATAVVNQTLVVPATEVSVSVANLGNAGAQDNYHQRDPAPLGTGVIVPACDENPLAYLCAHIHWRWGAFFGKNWGKGVPLPPRWQFVDTWVLRFNAPGEVDPAGFNINALLAAPPPGSPQPIGAVARDLTFWESTLSTAANDMTSQNHWFFH